MATRALRNMLLQRLSDMRRIDKLESRMDKAELNIKQIQGGVNYLVKQLAAPPKPPAERFQAASSNAGRNQSAAGASNV